MDSYAQATRAVPEADLLAGLPPAWEVGLSEVAAAASRSQCSVVVLDDDPTGSQSVADVPLLMTWAVDDLRWGLGQPSRALYVLTNTRSLEADAMKARNDEVIKSLVIAARAQGANFVVVSRSDSTLRGHFPEEVDAISASLAAHGQPPVDGVIVVPAYLDAGRLTVRSVHWVRVPEGYLPVGLSEFARDATFGFRSSELRDYVAEKSSGRWRASDVRQVTVDVIRRGGPTQVATILEGLNGGAPVVADAVTEDDLRVLALAAMTAEERGKRLLYRAGPSFVRARAGLGLQPALSPDEIATFFSHGCTTKHGLVVVGSHVPRTTRQLQGLAQGHDVHQVELDVPTVLSPRRDAHIDGAARDVAGALAKTDVVLATSRRLVVADGRYESLEVARSVSAALVAVVKRVVRSTVPAWVLAKGGITASDTATRGLGVQRAWARGTLLPGMVSLWQPVSGLRPSPPYIVFAGNVGDDGALSEVVSKLRHATSLT